MNIWATGFLKAVHLSTDRLCGICSVVIICQVFTHRLKSHGTGLLKLQAKLLWHAFSSCTCNSVLTLCLYVCVCGVCQESL